VKRETKTDKQSPPKCQSLAETLTSLVRDVRVIRAFDNRFYASVLVHGHREMLALDSAAFAYWLIRRSRQHRQELPSADAIGRLARALQAEAAQRPPEPVGIRVAGVRGPTSLDPDQSGRVGWHGSRSAERVVYYVDLGDPSWAAVEITPEGCRVVDQAPVWFRRTSGMRPLPRPAFGGSIDLLKKYVNLSDTGVLLLIAWITAALRPYGPFPILVLTGEQGSAKSTMARVARQLIDPSAVPLRALPRSQQDMMIEAHNSWLLVYDNVCSIPPLVSDNLCRIATGGGLSTRALYSNDDATLFSIERPTIVTGIDDFVRRSDLIDRCVFLELPAINDQKRRFQTVFWDEFEVDYPHILGALLDAVSGGLSALRRIALPALPRMADFARWGEAVGRSLGWNRGAFLAAYNGNRQAACVRSLEECPVAQAVRQVVDRPAGYWSGTATDLLRDLNRVTTGPIARSAAWPKTPRALSSLLRRLAPQLRTIGTTVEFDRVAAHRLVHISSNRNQQDHSVTNEDADCDACPPSDGGDDT
jgi:hypothetical protein